MFKGNVFKKKNKHIPLYNIESNIDAGGGKIGKKISECSVECIDGKPSAHVRSSANDSDLYEYEYSNFLLLKLVKVVNIDLR